MKNNKISKLLQSALMKDAIVYGLTNALYTGLPILLMPFLITVLKPEDYGMVELFRSITMVITPILGLSAVQAVTRFYYDLNESEYKVFLSSINLLQIFSTLVALILILIFSSFISKENMILGILAVIFFLFNQITESLLSVLRVNRMSLKYSIVRISIVIIDLVIMTILYFSLKSFDWTFRVYPNLISTVIIGIASFFLFWKMFSVKFNFDLESLKVAVAFSSPLIFHMISGYILNVGDRFFITYFLGTSQLGNYSVAYQIGLIVSFFFTSFNLAWTPTFFEWMKEGRLQSIRKVKIIVFIAIPLLAIVSIGIWMVLSRHLPNMSNYNVDLNLIIVITMAYVIASYYRFNSNYYFYYKKTKTLASITIVTGLICVGLYIVLIPRFELMGAAVATLITFILMFLSTYIFKPNEKQD